jgi:hypothetical protein
MSRRDFLKQTVAAALSAPTFAHSTAPGRFVHTGEWAVAEWDATAEVSNLRHVS